MCRYPTALRCGSGAEETPLHIVVTAYDAASASNLLQACNCDRRVRAGATGESSRVKFPRCCRKERLRLRLSEREQPGSREKGRRGKGSSPKNECRDKSRRGGSIDSPFLGYSALLRKYRAFHRSSRRSSVRLFESCQRDPYREPTAKAGNRNLQRKFVQANLQSFSR